MNYTENDINIINTSYHKKMTDRHLAQINFTATIPQELWDMYIAKTSIDHENLGRIRFMKITLMNGEVDGIVFNNVMVFGRVSHGYGYDISQDIFNSIMYSKGVMK